MNKISFRQLSFLIVLLALFVLNIDGVSQAQQSKSYIKKNILDTDPLLSLFQSPPDSAKPIIYWFWQFNRVTKEGITRDLEQFKAKGISGVNLICTGGYAGKEPLPGVKFLGEEWRALFRYAVREANKLHI